MQVRLTPRVPFRHPVAIRCNDWAQAARFYTENISLGGLFVASEDPLPKGTTVDIQLLFPDGAPLKLQGFVVRAEAGGMGIRFMAIDQQHRDRLEQLVALAAGAQTEEAPVSVAPDVADLRRDLQTELVALEGDAYASYLSPDAPDDHETLVSALETRHEVYDVQRFARYGCAQVDTLVGRLRGVIGRRLEQLEPEDETQPIHTNRVVTSEFHDDDITRKWIRTPVNRAHKGRAFQAEELSQRPTGMSLQAVRSPLGDSQAARLENLLVEVRSHVLLGRLSAAERLARVLLAQAPADPNVLATAIWVDAEQIRRTGTRDAAIARFKAVLKLDHHHREAIDALRTLSREDLTAPIRRS